MREGNGNRYFYRRKKWLHSGGNNRPWALYPGLCITGSSGLAVAWEGQGRQLPGSEECGDSRVMRTEHAACPRVAPPLAPGFCLSLLALGLPCPAPLAECLSNKVWTARCGQSRAGTISLAVASPPLGEASTALFLT